jgi:hypothetical protein
VLRVSIVRIELCSTRTIGRSAWSGILKLGGDRAVCGGGGGGGVGIGVGVGVEVERPLASVTAR